MQDFFGGAGRLTKFLSLGFGILMFAATVVTLAFGNLVLTIACAVVTAWSFTLFTDILKQEIVEQLRTPELDEPEPEQSEQRENVRS